MPLKGYVSQAPQVQSATQVSDVGLRAGIQASQDFTSRLKEFKDFKDQQRNREAKVSARDQAYRDAKENKPFDEKVNNMYGQVYNEVRTATYAADAELQISGTSTELLMAYENDPEAYDNAMRSYVDGMADAAPTEQLQSVIAIGGHKRRNESYGNLKVAEHGRIKAASIDTFNRSIDLNVNQIIQLETNGDMQRAEFEKQKNLEYIGTMLSDGNISEVQAQQIIRDSEYKITYGTAMNNMEELLQEPNLENASKYLQGATAEARGDMNIAENQKYNDDLTKMFNNEVKARKATISGNKEYANLVVGKVNKILASGKTPPIELMKEAEALSPYASLAKSDSMRVNLEAYNIVKQFDNQTLPEQEAILAGYKANPKGTDISLEVLEQVEKNLSSRKAAAKKDPQSQSVVEGRAYISPINVTNGINALTQELPNRVRNQQGNLLEYGKGATQLFTDTEASEWSSMLEDVNTPMSEKIAFMGAIYETIPEKANSVFNQLRKKGAPLFTFAASLVGDGKEEVAKGVLRGQGLLKAVGPQEYVTEFRTTLLGKIGNAMTKSNPADQEALVDSALAYSLHLAESKGDITNLKGLSERQAINDLTNGMYKRNSQDFFLPDSASKDDFDEWIDEKLTIESFAEVKGMTPEDALMFARGNRVRITSVGTSKYALFDALGRVLINNDGSRLVLEY